MLLGLLRTFAYIIAVITNELAEFVASPKNKAKDELSTFIRFHRVPKDLDRRLRSYYDTLLATRSLLTTIHTPRGYMLEACGSTHGATLGPLRLSTSAALGRLVGLVSLGLKSNRLRELPGTVGELSQLVHLFLTDNELTTLPAELVRCVSLRKIQASSNSIRTVPDDLARMPALEFCRRAAGS